MNSTRIFSATVFLLIVTAAAEGQSKKEIREMGITSITVQEYFIGEGMDDPVVESIEKFDEEGELVEIQEFNKTGEVKKWEKYVYNTEGQLIEQVFLDEKGRIIETEKNIYEGELRVEKQFYNNKGNLYKKKVYVYEYRK